MYRKVERPIILIIFIIIISVQNRPVATAKSNLDVHFINVGQGDSFLIKTPKGKHVLIDGGPPEKKKVLINYLLEEHVEEIDLLIATHPDIDHIGGLISIIQKFKIKEVIYPNKSYHTRTYKKFKALLKQNDMKEKSIQSDKMIVLEDDVIIHFMNTFSLKKKRTNNEASLVIKLTHKDVDFLFMSDVGIFEEKIMMKQYDMRADILKVGHHGSNTSSSKYFLEAVQPRVSIFTYGRENTYGHPVKRVIKNLQEIDTMIYATATHGHIEVKSDGNSYFILNEKSPLDELSQNAS